MRALLRKLRKSLALFGPGLLYAGAAVGVSHLVQSTRAGAEFGYQLLIVVIIVNLIKYPIFELGPRYAAATGETLLDGYRRLGAWAVVLYVTMTVATMFIVMGAISIVTAGLFANLFGLDANPVFLAILLLVASMLVLGVGHYHTLDRLMKFVIVMLTLSTVVTVFFGFLEPGAKSESLMKSFEFSDRAHLLFLVALIGWMPAPIDLSIWHSVWSVAKNRDRGSRIALKSALLDFKMGYWGTMIIAVCFLTLGAMLMYGTTTKPSENSIGFASQVVAMYTTQLGSWSYIIIAIAAFTTMFSTMLTCLDAFPRTLRKSTKLLFKTYQKPIYHERLYWFWIILTVVGTALILLNFYSNMKQMVDLATTVSFSIAPLLAFVSYVAMKRFIPVAAQPPIYLQWANIAAIGLLAIFSIWFLFFAVV